MLWQRQKTKTLSRLLLWVGTAVTSKVRTDQLRNIKYKNNKRMRLSSYSVAGIGPLHSSLLGISVFYEPREPGFRNSGAF